MKRKIKNPKDLPAWINHKRYEAAANLDALGWYWQLAVRAQLYWHHMAGGPYDYEAEALLSEVEIDRLVDENIGLHDELWSLLQDNPIIDHKSINFRQKFAGRIINPPEAGVRHASLQHLRASLNRLNPLDRKNAHEFLGLNAGQRHLLSVPCPFEKASRTATDSALLLVNYDLPEAILTANFLTIIREAKARQSEIEKNKKPFQQPNFKHWLKIGILPYLDLIVWKDRENVDIAKWAMAESVLHDAVNHEVVRKTTHLLADQILNGDMLQRLAGLCLSENFGKEG